jgi:phthalate 4,5-dioxygenase
MRLLGEDLIAFRDSAERVGMLGANCPHRGASLFFGRNEESGLRCVYHGWKFDVTGACVDMPNEPAESNFKHKVKAVAYPCVERAGVVWVYMGPREVPPALPELEWMSVPDSHRIVSKRVQFTNYAQALEGEIDSSHLGFTHSRVRDHLPSSPEIDQALPSASRYARQDRHPRFDVLDTDYGVLISAQRDAEPDNYYYRISQFLLPFWTLVASGTERADPTRGTRAFIPIDDESVMVFATSFHPMRPLTDVERAPLKVGGGAGFVGEDYFRPATTAPFGRWIPIAAAENDYLLDGEAQRTTHYSGMAEFWAQNAALQEGMGKIYDRSKERLGSSDTAIIRMRARLIMAAKALQQSGTTPSGVDQPDLYRVRASVAVLPRDVPWLQAIEELRHVVPGKNPGGPDLGLRVPSDHQRV